jgi:hypothetical protein
LNIANPTQKESKFMCSAMISSSCSPCDTHCITVLRRQTNHMIWRYVSYWHPLCYSCERFVGKSWMMKLYDLPMRNTKIIHIQLLHLIYHCFWVRVMVFNATFNNISVISWPHNIYSRHYRGQEYAKLKFLNKKINNKVICQYTCIDLYLCD